MDKATFAIKISETILDKFKAFCNSHGIKYSFFVEEAIKRKLEEEEMKEDLLDLKMFRKDEKHAVPFKQYLRERGV